MEELQKHQEESIKQVLDDAIRFGVCIGSWLEPKIGFPTWMNTAAGKCVNAIRDGALSEIKWSLKASDPANCKSCGQKLPEKKENE